MIQADNGRKLNFYSYIRDIDLKDDKECLLIDDDKIKSEDCDDEEGLFCRFPCVPGNRLS